MIRNLLKNICLITFALVGPITLPAGGIQRNLDEYKLLNKSKEIILNSNCYLYSFPKANAQKLILLNSGTLLSILNKWKDNETGVWVRVELSYNHLLENPNKISKGWLKS